MKEVADQPPPAPRPDLKPTWELVVADFEGRYEAIGVGAGADPVSSYNRKILDAVVADMVARDLVGRARYGTPLTAGNGRDHLVDAYQEKLDETVYLRNAIEEGDLGDAVHYVRMVYERTMDDLCGLRRLIHDRAVVAAAESKR